MTLHKLSVNVFGVGESLEVVLACHRGAAVCSVVSLLPDVDGPCGNCLVGQCVFPG